MKKKYILIVIFMLTLGFASVNTFLDFNGNISFGFKEDDFNVYIGFVGINDQINIDSLSNDKSKFQLTVLNGDTVYYTVVNDSYQYDVDVKLICDDESNMEIKQVGNIVAQSASKGEIAILDNKDIICHIEIDKIERTSIADDNILKKWFSFENLRDKDQSEVFSSEEYFNRLMSNNMALEFLLEHQELINIIKEDANYSDVLVPIILEHAAISKEQNSKFYKALLPCYIYNKGTYYLISSMTYAGPSNSCQTHTHSNSTQGLYFHIVGTTSASQSIGVHYSNQSVNPNGYSKLGVSSYFATNLPQYDTTSIGLYNGSVVSKDGKLILLVLWLLLI